MPLAVFSSGIISICTPTLSNCSITAGGPISFSPKINVGDKDNTPSAERALT